MGVAYKNAERLVLTELNAVENRASAAAMKEADFENYQYCAAMDRRTCARCGELDGEIFPLSAMNQGENAPPLHPRCRCTIVATFDSPGKRGKTSGERVARDENGRRTRVPADMTYKDWKAIYIDKSKTFDAWQKEMDTKYAAMPPTREQLRGREIIDKLSSGAPLTSIKPNDKVVGAIKPLTSEQIKEIRDAEDKAFKSKTGADFGFKMMRTSPDWAKEILMTNPPNKNYGHTPNCQRCVVAHEARMRGYDVIARPSWGANDTTRSTGEWLHAFDYSYADFKECVGATGEEVIESAKDIMRSFGEGARAIIVFKWSKMPGEEISGHVIVAQCREHGTVNFGDPQWGERTAAYKLKSADIKERIILLRVDNLKFTDTVKRCCMNQE